MDHIEVEGLRELRKALKAAGESYSDLKEAGLEAADMVASTARTLVPHLTGALEATIRPAGQAKGAVVRAGKGSAPYAGVQHFGWPGHNIAPHPFLYEAADQRAADVEELYLQRVQDIANTITGN
jgi:hypothetical protein